MSGAAPALVWLLAAAGASQYAVPRTEARRAVLLAAAGDEWKAAPVIRWGPAPYETTFRALWNAEGLYVLFEATDPDPWHTFTERDDRLWEQEVVEIFLDLDRSGTHYAELQWNPANVVCDFHVLAPLPDYKGNRGWTFEGVESRVEIRRDGGRVTGWTTTAFLPWSGLQSLPSARQVALPPRAGDRWRFNVFRVERPHGPKEPERDVVYAAWSPAPIPKFHVPEVFRDLLFEK